MPINSYTCHTSNMNNEQFIMKANNDDDDILFIYTACSEKIYNTIDKHMPQTSTATKSCCFHHY